MLPLEGLLSFPGFLRPHIGSHCDCACDIDRKEGEHDGRAECRTKTGCLSKIPAREHEGVEDPDPARRACDRTPSCQNACKSNRAGHVSQVKIYDVQVIMQERQHI